MANYRVVDADKLDADLTTVADAIRAKGGTSEKLAFPDGLVSAVEGIETASVLGELSITENGEYTPDEGVDGFSKVTVSVAGSGGGSDLLAAHFNRTMSEYHSEAVTGIPQYAFYWDHTILNVDVQNAKTIGQSAFDNAKNFESINAPNVATIGNRAFASTKVATGDFPLATSIGNYAFSGAPLTSINIPLITTLNVSALQNTQLEWVDLPAVTTLNDQSLSGCGSLTAVILRAESVVTMKYLSVFSGTPFAVGGTGGNVYVPSALIESYRTATNWSALYEAGTCNFVAIEGSEHE